MTSGVKWNEDYTDPNSDVARMFTLAGAGGRWTRPSPICGRCRAPTAPGPKWVYKTGETNLIGVLVHARDGKPLADLSEREGVRAGGHGARRLLDDRPVADRRSAAAACRCRCAIMRGWDCSRWKAARASCRRTGSRRRPRRRRDRPARPGFGYGYQWWTYPERAVRRAGDFRAVDHGRSVTRRS